MAPAIPDTRKQEKSEMENLLAHGLRMGLAFRPEIELKFQNFYRDHVVKSIRQVSLIAAAVYSLIGLLGLIFIPKETLAIWIALYASVAFVGLVLFRIPHSKRLQKHHQTYIGWGVCFDGTIILVTSFTLTGDLQQYILNSFIFLMMVLYTSNIINFKTASFAGWGCGAAATLITSTLHLTTHWGLLGYIFIISNIIGMGICYQNERSQRLYFLQQTLLALEKIQLSKMGEELKVISRQDGLTGIANRRHFEEYYKKEWLRGYRHKQLLSVIFIDIDFYKLYNDEYGHQQGDECLIELAQCLDTQASRPEDIVARYGGEEFIMLLPAIDERGAMIVAKRIQEAIADLKLKHKASDISDYVTVSMGIASTIPKSLDTAATLVRRADAALYDAKSSGRNCWRVAPSSRITNR
ncbi:MAG: GGDEF domain-containing protein [Pseudomonadales bacterium]|nr:GGDEF domain-containing protein [Pseudomonadales bacterium]